MTENKVVGLGIERKSVFFKWVWILVAIILCVLGMNFFLLFVSYVTIKFPTCWSRI